MLLIYAVGLPYLILRTTPARENLIEIDVTGATIELEERPIRRGGSLTITQGDSQFRRTSLSRTEVATIKRALKAPRGRITALVYKNPIYVGGYFDGPAEDYELFELAIEQTVLVSYHDMVRQMADGRQGAIIVLCVTGVTVCATWLWYRRKNRIRNV